MVVYHGPSFCQHVLNCCGEGYAKFGIAIFFRIKDISGFRVGGTYFDILNFILERANLLYSISPNSF